MLANLEEKKYCDEYKTDAQNKERAAYLAIFKWLSPEIAEKIDMSRIRTGTALLDWLKAEFLKGVNTNFTTNTWNIE